MIERRQIISEMTDSMITFNSGQVELNTVSNSLQDLIIDIQYLLYELTEAYPEDSNVKINTQTREAIVKQKPIKRHNLPTELVWDNSDVNFEQAGKKQSNSTDLEAMKAQLLEAQKTIANLLDSQQTKEQNVEASLNEQPIPEVKQPTQQTKSGRIILTEEMKKQAQEQVKAMTTPYVNTERVANADPAGLKATSKHFGVRI